MRVVTILVLLSVGLAVASYQLRTRMQSLSQVLLGFSLLFAVMLVAAFFNLV